MSIGATEVPVGAEPYGSGRGWVASAASFQTQTAAIAATARITHQPIGQLDADVRQLARDFPLGTAGAIATVEAVQRLGLSSKEQVPQIRAVSREVTQLAYATNTSAPAMATGFGQLNRQLASLDPSRLRRMGDVLTTVSARSGAAATDVLAFARGIAPLAQQAGIGETAVLGISGAFAKLGDDSGSAITAVNKILGDLNRSVREGSNDMAAYAQITGMTVDKFRELYKANPAQALAAVTTSIGRAGPRGSYQLETLGLEGVRTQRSLLELSQSGGLQAAVDQAVGAYGNGSTAKAAEAATQGLDDALTRFHTTAGQVGQVMAGPVLKPMTAFVNLLQKLVSPLTAVAGTRGAQDLITAGVFAGGAGLLGKRVFGGMQAGATGALIGTSGPVRGFAGGIAAGRAGGDLGLALDQGMLSRYGGDMLIRQTAGAPLGSPMMHPVNTAAMRAGAAVGSLFPVGGYGGYGLRQAVSDLPYLGGAGAGAYLRSQSELFRLARTPAADRQLVMRPFGEAYTKFADTRTGLREQLAAGTLSHGDYRDAMGGALKTLREEVRSTSSIFHGLSQTSSGLWAVLKEGVMFGGYAGKGVVKAGAGMLGGLASSIGLPTLALGAGVGAYSLYERNRNEQKTFDTHVENLDIYGAVNAYRDAVGKAGEATITLADQMAAAVKTVSASVQSFPAAQHVSNSDLVAANSSRNKITRRYSGSNTQIAAQVSALDLAGLEPSDVQGAKLDLLRAGVSADQVDSILSSVGTPGGVRGQGAAAAGSLTPQMISGLVGGAAKAPGLGSTGFGWRWMQRQGGVRVNSKGIGAGDSLWYRLGHTGSGTPQLGKQAGAMVDELSGALGQERFNLGQKFGDSYGLQRELKDADKAMGVALKTHRADLVVGMEQQLTKQLTGKTIHGVSASDIESAGGFEKFLAARGVKIGGQSVADMMAHPTAARLQPSYMQNMLSGLGASALVPFFSSTTQRGAAGVAQQTVADSVANPQDLQRQADAVNTMVTAAQKAGVSLSTLAAQAGGALGSTSQNDVNYQLLLGVISESQRRQAVAAPFMTPGQQFGAQAQTGLAMAGVTGNDTNAQNLRQQGLSTLADLQLATVASFHARIMAQYSFEVESRRAGEDYHRQLSRSEQDFQIQRYRTIRDYNIQVRREIQDAAAQDYNPYQRIQAQPVWDAFNLIGNLTEHRDALRAQVANIRKLKERGFTDSTLRLLDAYNPANAQQIAELAADLGSAPNLAGQYNKVSAQTESAAGQLLTGAPTYQRQRADFKRAMADQKADFDRQEARGHTDFLTAMSRQAQDLHAQDLVITGDMTSLQADMNRILHGQQLDWSTTLVSGLKDTLAQVKKYAPQITTTLNTATTGNGSGVVAGPGYGTGKRTWAGTPASSGGKTYARAGASSGVNSGFLLTSASRPGTDMNRYGNPNLKWGKDVAVAPDNRRLSANAKMAEKMATNYGWGDGPEWAALFQIWQQESRFSTSVPDPKKAGGIPQADPASKMASAGRDWRTNPATQIAWGLNYILEGYGDPLGAWAHKSRTGWYGDGSIFTSPQLIGVGERGSEAVLPLNAHGATFIADVMRSYLGDHDRSAMMGGGSVVINHTESHHYDQRIDLTGSHFEVKANTPRELADALEQKARADNLTKPRSVPWRT